MASFRALGPADVRTLEAFLKRHADSSMFLRSNLRAAGIVDQGRRYQATYVGAFRGGALVGVAALAWNGKILLQAPLDTEALAVATAAATARPVTGFLGPWNQVVAARSALGMEARATNLDRREALFALTLDELRVPERLATLTCRAPAPAELPALRTWRHDYDVEALGETPSSALAARAGAEIDEAVAEQALWVLLDGGSPVAMTALNARLPDSAQVGGVYTPPALRSRGYARCAVAGSLLDARRAGVQRAILFTGERHEAARRCYQSLGFEVVGDYGLVLF